MSFLPPGVVATFAHAAALGAKSALGGRKRRKKRATKAPRTRKAKKTRSRKPKPGTKAWMAYIRGMRKK